MNNKICSQYNCYKINNMLKMFYLTSVMSLKVKSFHLLFCDMNSMNTCDSKKKVHVGTS